MTPRRWARSMALLLALATTTSLAHAADTPADRLASAGIPTGFVVRAGTDDLATSIALAKTGRYLVHQLVAADKLDTLRRQALDAGISGRLVLTAADPAGTLPHPARLADAFLLEPGHTLKDAEIRRVLNVGGQALLHRADAWEPLTLPAPDGLDDWTHKWHGPSGNVLSRDTKAGPPVTVQWVAGPALADGATGGKHPVIAGGHHAAVDNVDGAVQVRSAGSGLPQWRLDTHLSVAADLVLDGGQLLCRPQADSRLVKGRGESGPLVAYDLKTGRPTATYAEIPQAAPGTGCTAFPATLAVGDRLVSTAGKDLAVLDRATGKRLWSVSLPDASWFSPIVLDDLVIACQLEPGTASGRGRIDNAPAVAAIAAFNLADGKPRWRLADPMKRQGRKLPDPAASLVPLVAGEGKVFLHASSYQCRATDAFIAALDATTGQELWRFALPEGGKDKWSATDSASRIIVRDGKLYYIGGHSLGGVAVFDAATGKILHEYQRRPRFVGYGGECSGSLATVNWLIMSGVTWWDKDLATVQRPGSRSACGTGVFPAQGMVFANPAGCDCTQYTRGYIGLACEPLPAAIPDAQRLLKGPAQAPAAPTPDPDAWPMFLANPQRTAFTSASLPATLREQFRVAAAPPEVPGPLLDDRQRDEYWIGPLTAPVAASGKLVVGLPDANALAAFDASTGKLAWRVPLGGPIDTPPTLYKGLVLAGCHAGCIYALRLDSGALVWKFQAAPTLRTAMLNGRLASASPVPGSVMILNDTLLATAGYHSYLGGIEIWALDPATGTVKSHDTLAGGPVPTQGTMVLNDILCAGPENTDAWIFTGCRIGADGKLAPLPQKQSGRPAPVGSAVVRIDRRAAVVRFPHAFRGGSTHGWNRPMASGPVAAYRIARDNKAVYGLADIPNPSAQYTKVPVIWARALDADPKADPLWSLLPKDLGVKDGYTALIKAGDKLYLGGGSRDGKTGFVQVISTDGKLLQELPLPAQVTPCGLAAAAGHLYASCLDGTVVCLGAQ